jgi:hypothetical protein
MSRLSFLLSSRQVASAQCKECWSLVCGCDEFMIFVMLMLEVKLLATRDVLYNRYNFLAYIGNNLQKEFYHEVSLLCCIILTIFQMYAVPENSLTNGKSRSKSCAALCMQFRGFSWSAKMVRKEILKEQFSLLGVNNVSEEVIDKCELVFIRQFKCDTILL